MDVRAMHEENRAGWNEGAQAYEEDLANQIGFLKSGRTNFVSPEYRYLRDLHQWCSRAIHLQCAGGTDTLSLANLGAHEVIGIDISDRMIDVATRKARALNANAQFIRCDVLDVPADLDGTADLVYTGRGALCWIHDLPGWARVVFRLLKPGGKLYVFEGHPICFVFDVTAPEYRLDPIYGDYFSQQVFSEQGWPDSYIGDLGRPTSEHAVKHERQWRFGDVINPLIDAGLRVLRFEEHPDAFWTANPNMDPDLVGKLPQTYSLLMERPESL